VWLATSNDPEAMVSGQYFYHQKRRDPEPATRDEKIQDSAYRGVRADFGRAVSRLARTLRGFRVLRVP